MKIDKVTLMFALGLIILVSTMTLVSAAEWNNKLKYSEDDMLITFQNTLLGINFLPIGDIGEAELQSHRTVDEIRKVPTGKDRVLTWYEFTDFKDVQVSAIKEVEFIDLREEIANRSYLNQFRGKEKLLDNAKVMILNPNYNKPIDKEYSFVYYNKGEWLPYNSKDIPKGNIIIGVQADLFWGEYLDVVWNIYGEKLDKHAVVEGVSAGFVTVAPTSDPNGGDFTDVDTTASAGKFDSPVGAVVVTEIGWYANGATEEANFEVGIYTHNVGDNEPEAVVGSLSQTNAKGTGAGWKVASGLNIPISASTTYWIAFQLDNTATATNVDVEITTGRRAIKTSQTTLPSPWGTSGTLTDNRLYAIYALWEEAPAPFITLNAPANDTTIFVPTVDLQCTAFDNGGITNVSLQWDGTPEQTNTSGFNNTAYNFTKTMALGLHEWACEAYDDEDNINNTIPVFHITYQNDLTIALNAPINEFNSTSQTLDFNGTPADDTAIVNVSFILNATYNGTDSSITNNTLVNFQRTLAEGKYNWTMEACDAVSCVNATARNFTIDSINPTVTITQPTTVVNFDSGATFTFNATSADANLNTCWYNYNFTNTTHTCNTNTLEVPLNSSRNITAWANDTHGNLGSDFQEFEFLVFENLQTFNVSAFETENETFVINVTTNGTAPSSANLFYDGTEYDATISNTAGDNYNISRSIDIPLTAETKTWNFNITISGLIINSTVQNQIINASTFVHCGVAPTYLNLTFKNETVAEEFVTAEVDTDWNFWLGGGTTFKTLAFTNTTENANYSFCFTSNVNKSLTANVSMTYDNSISEQRNFEKEFALTNETTNQTLFLLPTTEGVFTTFQTVTLAEQVVIGVAANVTKSGNLIASGVTDDAGLIQYFLDPDTTYVFKFFKTGFDLVTITLKPTQSTFTVTMGGAIPPIANDTTKGISYTIVPTTSFLSNGTNTIFNLTLESEFWELDFYGFALKNSTGNTFNVTSDTTSTGGTVGAILNTANNTDIIMEVFWTINTNQTNVTRVWAVLDTSDEGFSINNFFSRLNTYLTSGLFGLTSFGLGIIVFVVIILTAGIISSKFRITDATGISLVVFALVLFFDVGLGIFPNPVNAVPNFPSIFVGLILIGTLIKRGITR